MTLEQINYFVLSAECLNFTEVARQTYTTQPTVSRQIALLEAELGYPLFESKRKGMRLTDAGAYLYSELKKSMEIIDRAVDKARHITKNYFGTLKIGTMSENWMEKFFFPVLQELRQTCPGIQISYEKRDRQELMNLLEADKLDVVFSYSFDPIDQKVYKVYDLGEVGAHMILSCNHPLLEAAQKDFTVLKDEHFYFLDNPEYYGQAIVDLCLPPEQIHIVNSFETAIVNVSLGNGVAIENELMYQSNMHDMFHTVMLEHRFLSGANAVAIMKCTNQNPSLSLLLNLLFP